MSRSSPLLVDGEMEGSIRRLSKPSPIIFDGSRFLNRAGKNFREKNLARGDRCRTVPRPEELIGRGNFSEVK